MKKLNLFLFFLILILNSCTDSLIETKNLELAHNKEKKIQVQRTSIDEYNAVMKKHNLPTYTPNSTKLTSRCAGDCGYTFWYGDWNGDGWLNTLDLVEAQTFLCNNGGCSSNYSTSGSSSYPAIYFATISGFWCQGQNFTLNEVDIEAARDVVLGINCY